MTTQPDPAAMVAREPSAEGQGPSREAEFDHVGRRLRTLEQLALHRRTIRVTCPGCERTKRFDAVALWWLYQRRGWPDDVPAGYGRLRCSRCGRTAGGIGRPKVEVTRDRPDEEQPPYPDEASWKRLVSRYRS